MVAAYDSTPAGLKALNDFLESRSFLEGFSVSQADTFVFNKIAANVDAKEYPNVVRWHRHIASYGADMLSFPGEAPTAEAKDDTPAEKAAASKGDDSDSDSDSDSDDDDFEIPESSDDEDSDLNLDEIARKRKEERLAREKEKMAKAKSIIVFDVKPYDAETDMDDMAKHVKAIEMDGLNWGAYKLVPVAFGVKKLQISVVVVDSKVSTDLLEEKIMEIPGDIVQSIDIQSFNKL